MTLILPDREPRASYVIPYAFGNLFFSNGREPPRQIELGWNASLLAKTPPARNPKLFTTSRRAGGKRNGSSRP